MQRFFHYPAGRKFGRPSSTRGRTASDTLQGVRNWPWIALGVLALALALCQFVLPGVAEREVKDRIEANGGTASVEVSAFPALRLLWGDGDKLRVRGSGVDVELEEQRGVLDRLDGFDSVDIHLEDVSVAPLNVDTFELSRTDDGDTYRVRVTGATSPADVAAFLGSRAGGPLGGLLGDLAADTLPGDSEADVPVDIMARVASIDGEVEVTSASGSVAGVPAGPLAELVVEAVARSL